MPQSSQVEEAIGAASYSPRAADAKGETDAAPNEALAGNSPEPSAEAGFTPW